MTSGRPLPLFLHARPFLVREALATGVSPSRLRAKDLLRPYRGVRTPADVEQTLRTRCRALAVRLDPETLFSHTTAALLLGIPLPLSIESAAEIHVSVFEPARSPRLNGVSAHQLRGMPHSRWIAGGLPITSPVLTWCQLAEVLSVADLVAAADFLVSGTRPLATIDEIARAAIRRRGHRGARRLAAAAPLVRVGPRSRPETHGRLLYCAAGLPEPELNFSIFDAAGRFVAMVDLAWQTQRVANEYEGKHHQGGKQFRLDVLRRERVEDQDWRLSRFTADDLSIRPAETVIRLSKRLGIPVSDARVARAVALSRTFGR